MLNIQVADFLYALAIMIAMGGVGWFIGYGIADSIKGKLWFAIAFFILTGVALVGHSWHLF
jgi:energy-converting hydrogenase Eha subunit E